MEYIEIDFINQIILDGKIELVTKDKKERKSGFSSYIDILDEIHKDILIKVVNEDDLTMVYNIKYKAVYRGNSFNVNSVGEFLLQEPTIFFSNDIDGKDEFVGILVGRMFQLMR